MTDLGMCFHKAMVRIFESAKNECHYNATCFLQRLSEEGELATARTLLVTPAPSEGFTTLWECGRLDHTVEAHVLKPEVTALFIDEEKSTARRRLEE